MNGILLIVITLLPAIPLVTSCGSQSRYTDPATQPPAPVVAAVPESRVQVLPPVLNRAGLAGLLAEGQPLQIIDVRSPWQQLSGSIPGAVSLRWENLSEERDEVPGLLVSAERIAATLFDELQLDRSVDTVVYGRGAAGWGEEGRILWILQRTGFTSLAYLDGGYGPLPGPEAVHRQPALPPVPVADPVTWKEIRSGAASLDILDVRTREEYEGAVLYDEPRGGHLPGAAHLPLAAFFGKGGLLLTGEDLRRVLAGAGINGDRPVLAYCTGGVRSALAWWAIRHGTGYEVLNYDGSWWEWSRRVPAAP